MHNISYIRENPTVFDTALKNRNFQPASAEILATDEEKRQIMTELQQKQARRNELATLIATARRNNGDFQPLENEASQIKEEIRELEQKERDLTEKLTKQLEILPNIPLTDVPVGPDESFNKCVRVVGTPPAFDFTPKPHYELGERLGLIDFQNAAKISGSRFTILRGTMAKLERAVKTFMLDIHTKEFGYEEIFVPLLVNPECMYGTGQLPKFKEDSFWTTDNRSLIPTAEVPLTNLVRESIIPVEQLPMRVTAYSQCFRSEAGAAGRDTRGMIRNHQFSKVELVSVVHPKDGEAELERMTHAAETILQRLGLAYRVMMLSTGDMGFSARKTYDLEVWIPSENVYREISSCSYCGDFQARRMNARYKDGKNKGFVNTLNGSGLAVGRTIVAILENYQLSNGNIKIPEALVPYMDGIRELNNGK